MKMKMSSIQFLGVFENPPKGKPNSLYFNLKTKRVYEYIDNMWKVLCLKWQ